MLPVVLGKQSAKLKKKKRGRVDLARASRRKSEMSVKEEEKVLHKQCKVKLLTPTCLFFSLPSLVNADHI